MRDTPIELQRIRSLKEKEKALQSAVDGVKQDSLIFERIVNRLIEDYCDELDSYVRILGSVLEDIRRGKIKKYSELKLEIRALELATKMYKATDGLAVLGSQSDVAKANRKERFDQIYATIKEGTIPDKTAEVNRQLTEELLVEKITERAVKVLSQKLKNANRLLEAIKKVLTSQMIAKEIWRKEAPVYDIIDGEYEDDPETETRDDGEEADF